MYLNKGGLLIKTEQQMLRNFQKMPAEVGFKMWGHFTPGLQNPKIGAKLGVAKNDMFYLQTLSTKSVPKNLFILRYIRI